MHKEVTTIETTIYNRLNTYIRKNGACDENHKSAS